MFIEKTLKHHSREIPSLEARRCKILMVTELRQTIDRNCYLRQDKMRKKQFLLVKLY
jgi:hypothetical protein